MHRPVWAEIDLDALRHNVGLLGRICAPSQLCVVVKADGYGHGAISTARAALEGGASWLAVALVEEGMDLRQAGIDAPVLVLSEPPPDAMDDLVANRLTPTVYTVGGVEALAKAAQGADIGVHVKVDTGMHRVGADPGELPGVVRRLADSPGLRFDALWTHFAVADGTGTDDVAYTQAQLELLQAVRAELAGAGLVPAMAHAANSAGAICYPAARLDMVRCGIAAYGLIPDPGLEGVLAGAAAAAGWREPLLQPVLSLHARVSHVRRLEAGERPSYGRRLALPQSSVVATVPIGYADGVPRRLGEEGGTVLIGGRRRPLAGTVTMDQIVVDCGPDVGGPDVGVAVGDHVVLIGSQGAEAVSAWDWANLLGTIAYEVVCDIGARVPRVPVSG